MAASFRLAIVLCTLVAAVSARTELAFFNCGFPDVTVKSVYMESDELEFGRMVYFTTTGIANRDVSGGFFTITVTQRFFLFDLPYFFVKPYFFVRGSACKLMGEPYGCSVTKGSEVTLKYEQEIPRFAYNGDYMVTIRAQQSNGRPLACVRIPYTLNVTTSAWESEGQLEDRRFLRIT